MGNTKSAKKQQLKIVSQQGEKIRHGKMAYDSKKILLIHKSNEAQLKVVRNFRDAFTAKTIGTVSVTHFVNIADGNEIPRGLAWLNELHNVVLIYLTSEDIEAFQRIISEMGFADQNGYIHPKVFTVTFGESLSSKWPPKGLKKGSQDLRDFHLGFSDVEKLRPQDFERSLRLNSLVAAIKGADITEVFQ